MSDIHAIIKMAEKQLWILFCCRLSFQSQNGGTPLLYAVRGNHIKCVKALLGTLKSFVVKSLQILTNSIWKLF